MVILLPVVLVVLVFGVLGGGAGNFVVVLPMLLVLGAGAGVVTMVLRDARPPRNPSVRQLPTDHLRRHMYRALRPHRSKRDQGQDKTPD
ncbi:MAG: hypothetical protein ACRDYF_10770 [Acidimicrobiia bacterium]